MNIQVVQARVAGTDRPFVQVTLGPRPEPNPISIKCPWCYKSVPIQTLPRTRRPLSLVFHTAGDQIPCEGSDIPVTLDTEYGQQKLV